MSQLASDRDNGPVVSVVIPCYNQARYLDQAIDSLLAQTYRHVEIIVVDDGSPDNTHEVAARYGDRVRYVRKENFGLPAAVNTGILHATGEFLIYLDADDYLWPDMIARLVNAAQEHPGAAVYHGDCQYVDSNRNEMSWRRTRSLPDDAFHHLLKGNYFACHCLIFRRSILANAGLFDPTLRSNEDWDLWIRIALAGGKFVSVPGAVGCYRQYPGSMSKNYERMWLTGLDVLRKNQRLHGNCPLCREAAAQGRRTLREGQFGNLWYDMRACQTARDRWAFLGRALRLIRRDPALLRLFLREPVLRLRVRYGKRVKRLLRRIPAAR
ncbi:MAG TPA: glycosyltransferase family 2 protein [Chthonomonadaceae bacterium]|nr:glycosyltransferase family 2 protein [Chthonomonadaceae bacterium]